MLNYKQLYYFWNVAKTGSITRAAEQLHLTPQTLSGQIGKLEKTLGTDLFRRAGRRLALTAAGKAAQSHANEIFEIGSELEALLRSPTEIDELPFRVGLADVVPKSIAYRLLAPSIRLEEPVRLICHDDKMERLFAELAVHHLDLVIADRPMPSELGVRGYSHALGRSTISFMATPELAEHYRPGFPRSLQGAPLLIPGGSAAVRGTLEHWLERRKLQPHIVGEFDDTALMKAFGQAGVGIFPVPTVTAGEVCSQYGVETVGCSEEVTVAYYAISLQRRLTHPAVAAVREAARDTLFLESAGKPSPGGGATDDMANNSTPF